MFVILYILIQCTIVTSFNAALFDSGLSNLYRTVSKCELFFILLTVLLCCIWNIPNSRVYTDTLMGNMGIYSRVYKTHETYYILEDPYFINMFFFFFLMYYIKSFLIPNIKHSTQKFFSSCLYVVFYLFEKNMTIKTQLIVKRRRDIFLIKYIIFNVYPYKFHIKMKQEDFFNFKYFNNSLL